MSGAPDHDAGQGPQGDPSMEDILASIRRILTEDPSRSGESEEVASPPAPEPPAKDVLVLDEGMMARDPARPEDPEPPADPLPPAPPPAPVAEPRAEPAPLSVAAPPPEPTPVLLGPEAAQAASQAMSQLASALAAQRLALVHRGGPTIEDLVREEIRPLLKAWLDTHLPPLVERLVRTEIERLGVGRAH